MTERTADVTATLINIVCCPIGHMPIVNKSIAGGSAVITLKTSVDVVARLNSEVNAWLADAKVKARLADLGGSPAPGTPAEFGRQIVAETEKWAQVVKFSGAKAE